MSDEDKNTKPGLIKPSSSELAQMRKEFWEYIGEDGTDDSVTIENLAGTDQAVSDEGYEDAVLEVMASNSDDYPTPEDKEFLRDKFQEYLANPFKSTDLMKEDLYKLNSAIREISEVTNDLFDAEEDHHAEWIKNWEDVDTILNKYLRKFR